MRYQSRRMMKGTMRRRTEKTKMANWKNKKAERNPPQTGHPD